MTITITMRRPPFPLRRRICAKWCSRRYRRDTSSGKTIAKARPGNGTKFRGALPLLRDARGADRPLRKSAKAAPSTSTTLPGLRASFRARIVRPTSIRRRWCTRSGTRRRKRVCWYAPGTPDLILDEQDDPLRLADFFPNSDPVLATTSNDKRVPVPDYTEYQDQARELDILTARIDRLTRALKVSGIIRVRKSRCSSSSSTRAPRTG